MAQFDMTSQDAILKDIYTDEAIEKQTIGKHAFFALISKKQGRSAGGKRYIQPVQYAHSTNESAEFAEAMANGTSDGYEDFILTRKKQYKRITVDNELLLAAQDAREETFVPITEVIDRGLESFGQKLAHRLARTAGGSIGKLAISSTNTTTLTFSDSAAVFNFQVGAKLQFSTTDGTGSLLDGGDYTTVTAVDHDAGSVTIADNLGTKISGVTTTSYVFMKGDYHKCISGLEDWLPVDDRATRLAAAFHGVTRSIAPVPLAGVYLDATGFGGLDEVMIKLVGNIRQHGGEPNLILANPKSLTDLDMLTNSRVKIMGESALTGTTSGGKKIVGISGYKVRVGDMLADVVGDRSIPSTRLYALTQKTWTLWHAGKKLIHYTNELAGGPMMRQSENEDASECRMSNYMQLGCSAPAYNGVAKINPAA